MYLIVGLGNPEPEYSFTRHNMGFDVINKLAEKYNINVQKEEFNAIYGTGIIENEKVILCKPQTYMNLSGDSVIQFMNYYKIDSSHVIIIYDDIDISPGVVKLRKTGGAGSHNGMKSVIQNMGTTYFPHVRVGTGTPENKSDLINYVIGKVPKDEYGVLKDGIEIAVEAITLILKNGIDNAMNIINAKI